jgi:Mce-associated membrane protein
VTEHPPPTAGPDEPTGPDAPDIDRIARLRARAAEPAAPPAEPAPTTQFWTPAPVAAGPPPPEPAAVAASDVTSPVADAPAGRVGRVGPPAVAAVVVLAVLAAVTVALAGLVASRVSSVNAVDATRGDVVGAATSGVATVLSYDYRHLDSDFARAQGLLTASFRKQYDDTTAKGVRPLAAKYKAISSADVSAAGVVEDGRDRAVVLVFVNQTVTNSQLSAPRLDRSRIKVSLVRSHGRWLIDKLTTL